MSEGKSHPLPRKSLPGVIARTGAAISLALAASLGGMRAIEGVVNKDPDVSNVVDSLKGFDFFLTQSLATELPNGIKPTGIIMELSEGKAATLKHPGTNTPYYNTITLEPNEKSYLVTSDDSTRNAFIEGSQYNTRELINTIKGHFALEWIHINYQIPQNTFYASNASPDVLNKIDAAINESITQGYEYSGPQITLENTRFQLPKIESDYSINPNVIPGPYTVAQYQYTVTTREGFSVNINIVNSENDQYATMYVGNDSLRLKQSANGQSSQSVSLDVEAAKQFMHSFQHTISADSQQV